MRVILEELGGSVVYAIAGGGVIGIFCLILSMASGF